jgi:hypothetical protein
MDEEHDLSSAALALAGGGATLAYWLGPCDHALLRGADAVGISRAMAHQYDVEAQADRTGIVIPDGVYWQESFAPVDGTNHVDRD